MGEKILNSFLILIEQAKTLAVTEMPDILTQYLGATALTASVSGFFALMLSVVLLTVAGLFLYKRATCKNLDGIDKGALEFFAFLSTCIMLVLLGVSTHFFVKKYKIELYPKGYLMEQVLKMNKKD